MRVGSIFGISITVNPSWVFVFALVAWSFANPLGPLRMPDLTPTDRALLGAFASALFFVSVLVHELAHSLVARRRGIPVRGITLFIFGGVSAIEGEPATPPAEAWISAVGPLASLAIGFLLFGLAPLFGNPTALHAIVTYLAIANVALAIFNILPAYPLDGGRVMHALLWRMWGDREKATRVTVAVGRVLAFALIVLGIVQTFATGFGGGLWTTFIGWYLLQAGNMEQSRVTIARALDGHAARELVASPELRVPADLHGDAALQYLREHTVSAVPVFVGASFIGALTLDALAHAPQADLGGVYVTSLMVRAGDLRTVGPGASAADAVRDMAQNNEAVLAVVADDGTFVGLFTRESAMHWIARAAKRA